MTFKFPSFEDETLANQISIPNRRDRVLREGFFYDSQETGYKNVSIQYKTVNRRWERLTACLHNKLSLTFKQLKASFRAILCNTKQFFFISGSCLAYLNSLGRSDYCDWASCFKMADIPTWTKNNWILCYMRGDYLPRFVLEIDWAFQTVTESNKR